MLKIIFTFHLVWFVFLLFFASLVPSLLYSYGPVTLPLSNWKSFINSPSTRNRVQRASRGQAGLSALSRLFCKAGDTARFWGWNPLRPFEGTRKSHRGIHVVFYLCLYVHMCTLQVNHYVPGTALPPRTNFRGKMKKGREALAVGFDPEMSNCFSISYAQNTGNYARTKSSGTNVQTQMTPLRFTA